MKNKSGTKRTQTLESNRRRSETLKKSAATPEARRIRSAAARLCSNTRKGKADKRKASLVRWSRKGERERFSRRMKHIYKTDLDLKERVMKTSLSRRGLSGLESVFLKLIDKYELPFTFVGDGKMILSKSYCPDFISDDGRILVELNGLRHNGVKARVHDNKKYLELAGLGYHVLVMKFSVLREQKEKELIYKLGQYLNSVRNTQAPRVIDLKMKSCRFTRMIFSERVKV